MRNFALPKDKGSKSIIAPNAEGYGWIVVNWISSSNVPTAPPRRPHQDTRSRGNTNIIMGNANRSTSSTINNSRSTSSSNINSLISPMDIKKAAKNGDF